MDFVDDEDLEPVTGRCISGVVPQFPDVIDAGIRCRVDLQNVHALSGSDFQAGGTLVARRHRWTLQAIQPFRQNARRGRFPNPSGAGKQVSVADPVHLDRILEGLDDGLLADDILKMPKDKQLGQHLRHKRIGRRAQHRRDPPWHRRRSRLVGIGLEKVSLCEFVHPLPEDFVPAHSLSRSDAVS